MSRRVSGRSFKITKNQAKGYGYANARSMKANPGVTTIAAINGRGSYRGRSARSAMSGLSANARVGRARKKLTEAEKRAFKARMSRGRNLSANRSTSSKQSATSKRNIRKAQSARKAWGRKVPRGKRIRVGNASYGSKPKARKLSAGVYIANRRRRHTANGAPGEDTKRPGKRAQEVRRKKRAERRKTPGDTMARRRKRASGLTKKRRSSKRRRKSTKKTTTAPKRRRRKARKGAARRKTVARKTVRRRRRKTTAKAAPKRRRRRSRKAAAVAPKRRRRAKSRRKTTSRKRRVSRKRRSSGRRKSTKASRRRKSTKKATSSKRRRKSTKSTRRAGGKRRSRKGMNRRPQTSRLLTANRRRRHRRNGRKLFKMNGVGDVLKLGAVVFGGFAAHRVLTNLFSNQVLARLLPAPAAPAATSGFDLSGQRGLIASLLVGAGSAFLASKVIKNPETRKLAVAGVVASTVHGVVLSLLKAFAPSGADMLAGPEDGTAARLSAMYGLGAGASIMPRYGAINGMGEYFREPMNGLGEYFREPMNGVGEYISATSGLGTYEANGDLFQAAAGMGTHDYQGNHIDPSGDLDRQLTIAEAAAGVGAISPFEAAAGIGPMQAAAGFGPMQAAAGFGAIDTVASGDTWIPGSVEPQLWAGAQAISRGQSATEMTPAGVLQTDGGQGIFG